MRHFVIYHDDSDGIGAMGAAYWHLNPKYGQDVSYLPIQYGQAFPIADLSKEDHVYVVDFAFSREVTIRQAERCAKFVTIDHHQGIQEALSGLPDCIVDESHSGAYLAWQYFNRNWVTVPDFIRYVEDYDLWIHETGFSYAVDAYLRAHPQAHTPEHIYQLLVDQAFLERELAPYKAIVDDKFGQALAFTKRPENYRLITFEYPGQSFKIVVYNTRHLINELAEVFYKDSDLNVDFTLSYFFTATSVVLNFRAPKTNEVNVGVIAKYYGGGGHVKASGVTMNFDSGLHFLSKLGLF